MCNDEFAGPVSPSSCGRKHVVIGKVVFCVVVVGFGVVSGIHIVSITSGPKNLKEILEVILD